jgi:hypothetical protein
MSRHDANRYDGHIARALATPGGHLRIGRGGFTLFYEHARLEGCDCETIKGVAVAAGLPVIDSRAVPIDIVARLAVEEPMTLRAVAAVYRRAGADVRNIPESPVSNAEHVDDMGDAQHESRRSTTYSCSDFVDSILDALGIEIEDEETAESPSLQADLALEAIDRLKETKKLVRSVKSALGTAEVGDALIEVARNARRAEMAHGALQSGLRDLLAWEQAMGGWEAPCWDRARRLAEGTDNG